MTRIPVHEETSTSLTKLKTIAYQILLAFTFLLPIFFVPTSLLSFSFAKSLFIGLVVIVVLAMYLMSVLKDGALTYPQSRLYWVVPITLIAYLLAAVLSGVPSVSLLGYGFEITTFSFVLILFLLMFLVSQLFCSRERIFYVYLAFLASFVLLAIFHLLRFIFGADFFSMGGAFSEISSNTIGKWSDMAVFFGAGALLSLITLEELTLSRAFRIIVQIALGVSVLFLAIVNFSLVWWVLGIFALAYFVYSLATSRKTLGEQENGPSPSMGESAAYTQQSAEPQHVEGGMAGRNISVSALAVLLISIVFILAGGPIGNFISQYLNVANVDVRPSSWSSTYEIAQNTISESPVFGSGPNRFLHQWLNYKPESVNQSQFWNADLNFGIGLIPTLLVTTGLLGFLAWIAFLGVFVYLGFRMLFARTESALTRYLITSSFLVALFFWIMSIVYVPSAVIFTLTFIFTGLFGGSLYIENMMPRRTISFYQFPRASFVAVLGLVLMLIAVVVFGYIIAQKAVASAYLQYGVQQLQQGNFQRSVQAVQQGAALGNSDVYYRTLSRVYLSRANEILSERQGNQQLPQAQTNQLQQAIQASISAAQQATQVNPTNYQNWQNLGQIYRRANQFGIEGAYDRAKEAYTSALERNPKSPALKLELARLEITNNNLEEARRYIQEARDLKQNYTEAIYLLAQIEASEGNIEEAIQQAQQAVVTSPNDPGLYFQLGLLSYSNEDYEQATQSFARAVQLVPRYANAKYFLGLSFYQLGQTDRAIQQFEDLTQLAPDNEQVQSILDNLKAGRAPIEQQQQVLNEQVEEDEELPVEEQGDPEADAQEPQQPDADAVEAATTTTPEDEAS